MVAWMTAFPSAELNRSFYRWPAPTAFRSWRDRLPDGFRLSVKAPRGLTRARKLYAPEAWLQRIWHCEETFALLAARGVAYCVTSGANLPCVLHATKDFVYVRMHGPDGAATRQLQNVCSIRIAPGRWRTTTREEP
jgi:uncharacterized protein YecE (DUF72 family)